MAPNIEKTKMSCPPTLTCSAYADGELPEHEAQAVAAHLHGCAACQSLVAGLAAESQALRSAMLSAESGGAIPAFVPRPTIGRVLAWLGWAAVAAWAATMVGRSLANAATLPAWLDWLAPDVTSTAIAFLVSTLVALVNGGEPFANILNALAWISLAAAGVVSLALVGRRSLGKARAVSSLLLLGTLVALTPHPAAAFEVRSDEQRVTVAAGEIIDDTLVVTAENVLIEGEVTGDLVAFGEQVVVRGRVGGMVVAAAESLSIEGAVGGSAFGMAETVDFRGPLGGNVYGLGNSVTVHPDVAVSGNAALAAETVELHGAVGKDLLAAAERVSVFGAVARNVRSVGERIEVGPAARIGGDLVARLDNVDELRIDGEAVISGTTDASSWPAEPSRYATPGYYVGLIVRYVAALLVGLALFRLFPELRAATPDTGSEVLLGLGIGALLLIAVPAVAVAATITLVGAPLGIITLLTWLVCMYLAGVVVADHLGRLILDEAKHESLQPLLLGLAIVLVAVNLPFVGGLLRLLVVALGLGLLGQQLYRSWRERPAQRAFQ